MGWVVPFSMAAATARASFSQLGMQQEAIFLLSLSMCPWIGSIALHINSPVVNVPVLSNAIVLQEASASRTYPPLSKIPYEHNQFVKICEKKWKNCLGTRILWGKYQIFPRSKFNSITTEPITGANYIQVHYQHNNRLVLYELKLRRNPNVIGAKIGTISFQTGVLWMVWNMVFKLNGTKIIRNSKIIA